MQLVQFDLWYNNEKIRIYEILRPAFAPLSARPESPTVVVIFLRPRNTEAHWVDNYRIRIIASKGTLDWGSQTFIYAATADALGYEVDIFFTSNGVQLLRKQLSQKITLYGHPGMPIPLINNRWFPNVLRSLPGIQTLITRMMERKMKYSGIPCLEELRGICLSSEITFIASQTSLELLNINSNDLIPEVSSFSNEAPIIANQNQNCLFLQF